MEDKKKFIIAGQYRSDTPFDQKSPGHWEVGVLNCYRHTDIALHDWIGPVGRISEEKTKRKLLRRATEHCEKLDIGMDFGTCNI